MSFSISAAYFLATFISGASIIILIFGTRRFRNMGGDLGSAFKNFRKAVKEEPEEEKKKDDPQ